MTDRTFVRHCRACVADGIILLENDGTLPLTRDDRVAVFGRAQHEYIKSGSGSAGRVNCPYVKTIARELKRRVRTDRVTERYYADWIAAHPYDRGNDWNFPASQEDPLPDEAFIREAAARNDKALFVIGRICGESYDCKPVRGDWYLSEAEERTIELLAKYFSRFAVVINSGNLTDLQWVGRYGVGAVVLVWQGGQEGAAGAADVLTGAASPGGRLPDTVALRLEDHPAHGSFGSDTMNIHREDIYVGYRYFETFAPDRVLYPFGYGLSYTTFSRAASRPTLADGTIRFAVSVTNTGTRRGREVVQVYFSAPQGVLGKPARTLVDFRKTKTLPPGKTQRLSFAIPVSDMASFDDAGKTGYPYSYVLERGRYAVFVGGSVRDAEEIFSFEAEKTVSVRRLSQALAPVTPFDRMTAGEGNSVAFEPAPLAAPRPEPLPPPAIPFTGDRGYTLSDVADGTVTMEAFVAQFDADALCALVRGEGMSSPKAPSPGTAGCFGGVASVWRRAGVPVVTTADGPSGVRMESGAVATCIPCATLLASRWDPDGLKGVFAGMAAEMERYGIDVILAPGMNLHRYPLGGRNFEYFSEDPLLTGRTAAAIARHLSRGGAFCTLKHFAANGQETGRGGEDEVMSERCARELYLKGFEIAVHDGGAQAVMTAYNRLNGVSAAGNRPLVTTILREEWGFAGVVMTDWWSGIDDPRSGTRSPKHLAAMIKAQNDLFMVVPDAAAHEDDLAESLRSGYLTLGELQRSAINILRFAMRTRAFARGVDTGQTEEAAYTECVFSARPDGRRQPAVVGYNRLEGIVLQADVPRDDLYEAELVYRAPADDLVQITERVAVDGVFSVSLVLRGTNDGWQTVRFGLYLRRHSELFFDGNVTIRSLTVRGRKETE